jgi:hypothetical protein
MLINLVPLLGKIVLLVFLVLDSQPGENQYGPNPKSEEPAKLYRDNWEDHKQHSDVYAPRG